MTFDYELSECVFHRNPITHFQSVFSVEEQQALVELCSEVFHRHFTNEGGVRLDYCKRFGNHTHIGLSEVKFYDFLLSNFSLFNISKLLNSATLCNANALTKLRDAFTNDGTPYSVESILSRDYLANTLAVSLLIRDKSQRFLLTKRSQAVGISSGFISVSVTGAIDGCDYQAEDPFRNCCQRELQEEMNYHIELSKIEPFMIACGATKLQPIVLANAVVDDLDEIITSIVLYKDFSLENSGYVICDSKELQNILADDTVRITEAARTHLENAIKNEATF